VKNARFRFSTVVLALVLSIAGLHGADEPSPELKLTPQDALETHGLSVFLFHNRYHSVFGDEKMNGLEMILHEQRIATNGDVGSRV